MSDLNERAGYQLATVRPVIGYSGGKASRTAVGQLRWMIRYVYVQDSSFSHYFATSTIK